ncbi:MAG: hypothetical protein GPOALKHO_001346 [Sodalis sp.]|nr:MAG: hypothetical protein GPOALKHO_001346 [Sodalis sp.]
MQIASTDDSVSLLRDGDTVMIGGSNGGHAVPETLLEALERRFQRQNFPQQLLTALYSRGAWESRQMRRLVVGESGLLKHVVCGALVDFAGNSACITS